MLILSRCLHSSSQTRKVSREPWGGRRSTRQLDSGELSLAGQIETEIELLAHIRRNFDHDISPYPQYVPATLPLGRYVEWSCLAKQCDVLRTGTPNNACPRRVIPATFVGEVVLERGRLLPLPTQTQGTLQGLTDEQHCDIGSMCDRAEAALMAPEHHTGTTCQHGIS